MEALIVRDLEKSYLLKENKHSVLNKLSFTATLGEITVLLGRSGCGKTTLLRLLSGLEVADAGTISIPPTKKVGMMFQEARLMPWLTCEENIAFGLPKNYDQKYIDDLIKTVGLEDFKKAYPNQLSGGMQQRAALARTLAQHSDIILMDEPFAALDYFTRLQMQQEVLRIKDMLGTGIVFVTHNIDEALAIGDKILVMDKGKISQEICIPKASDRDVLQEPFISFKKQILQALMY